jgi:hypothetical protein
MRAEEVPPVLADGMLFWTHNLILLGTGLAALAGCKKKKQLNQA